MLQKTSENTLSNMAYTNKPKEEILSTLKETLSRERYNHSIGAANMAVELAKKFKLNEEKAYTAGLLHDCAKCFDKEKLLEIIKTEIKDVDECELINYKTHHAPVSAYIAKKDFGVDDEEILSAIRWHTLGKINMSNFEKIIFLADKIEPNTRDIDYRNKILKILRGKNGLNQALLACYKETIKSLVKRDLKICQQTIDIYNSLQD
jgi:predicted HD superfamily hydrolase involved in NAD metabolism